VGTHIAIRLAHLVEGLIERVLSEEHIQQQWMGSAHEGLQLSLPGIQGNLSRRLIKRHRQNPVLYLYQTRHKGIMRNKQKQQIAIFSLL
jgi:hypothetical protein